MPPPSRIWRSTLAAVALAILAGCTSIVGTTPPASPSGSPVTGTLKPVHDPGQVTGTLTGPCQMTGSYPDQFPDRNCTPGSVDPAVTQANIHQTICVTGYTATVRPPEIQTEAFKFGRAYPAYGVVHGTRTELDHFIPLELGGSNDAQNLWPEPETSIPNAKDYVENAARDAVCSGRMKLATAQNAMAMNWVQLGQQLGVTQTSKSGAPPATHGPTAHQIHAARVAASARAAASRAAVPPPGTHAATSPAAPPAVSCYPTTSSSHHCYEPGEFCPKADNRETGIAGDGKAITCRGGRWED